MKEYLSQLNLNLFLPLLAGTYLAIAFMFLIASSFFGYELTNWDIPGTFLASPLVANLIYLLIERED